jgi:hypothetical protein
MHAGCTSRRDTDQQADKHALLLLLLLLLLCFRRYLYSQTAKWLRAGAGDYQVDALYVWTAGEAFCCCCCCYCSSLQCNTHQRLRTANAH